MAAFFQKVFVDEATFGAQQQQQQQPADESFVAGRGETRPSLSLVDLADNIVTGTSTCQELGHQVFSFFKVLHGSIFCASLSHLAGMQHRTAKAKQHVVAPERLLHTRDV